VPALPKYDVIPDLDVIRYVNQEPGRFAVFLGAGASAEAGVSTANQIAEEVLARLREADPAQDETELKRSLNWDDPKRRYATSLNRYGNEILRVEYFRKLLRGKKPAFCHQALALLMQRRIIRGTCLTTNFDKLIETSFAQQGDECQPIRMKEEARFWKLGESDRYYVIKLHGDYDTNNILNTRDETLRIDPGLQDIARTLLDDAGLIVLGSGGFEESVLRLFNDLAADERGNRSMAAGVYWGIYLGPSRPDVRREPDIREAVNAAITNGNVSMDIVEMMARANRAGRHCAFFPVWGSGTFMFNLIKASKDRSLVGSAEVFLDHEMRLRNVFAKAGLTPGAIDTHLKKLAEQRRQITNATRPHEAEVVVTAQRENAKVTIQVLYGDITSRSLMAGESFAGRRAVVSAEDTCISAGGGVAYALLRKAGPQTILNELSKLAPAQHREVVVTSGGNLPVHYIFHAAALKIEADATYSVTGDDVSQTVDAALGLATALDVRVLLVPLIAAGVGPLSPAQSFRAILKSLAAFEGVHGVVTIRIVVFKESLLPRLDIESILREVLSDSVLVGTTVS
jgi:O-acetyl-ADP-ribose deacetylase